jgi:ATP-dependent DNA ligase
MKCSGLDEKTKANIEYPAYCQLKSDGARCIISVKNGDVDIRSASGKPFEIPSKDFHDSLQKFETLNGGPVALDGELLVSFNGKIQERRIGNGIINKASKGTMSAAEAKSIVFDMWDIVDADDYFINQKSNTPYSERFKKLSELTQKIESTQLRVIESTVVNSFEEANAIAKKYMSLMLEGAIVKNFNTKWSYTRSKEQIKIKGVHQNEMIVVGVAEGKGRNVGKLGALECESNCGKIRVSVGSGFSDAQRIEYFSNDMIGKIITVEYNGKIQNKSKEDSYSLFLPTFIELRNDKDEADAFEIFN